MNGTPRKYCSTKFLIVSSFSREYIKVKFRAAHSAYENILVAGYDQNDNVVWRSEIVAKTPSNDECLALQPYEFEDDSYLDSNIQLVACSSYSVKGGFTGNKAAIITDRTELYSSIRYLIQDDQRGANYKLKVAVKMLQAKLGQEYRIKVRHFILNRLHFYSNVMLNVKVTVKEGDDFKQVYSAEVPQERLNDWQIVETEIEIGSETESFYITQSDYTGDFLVDRFYFTNINTWLNCRTVQK